ncbi:MAG: urease accessory protein UreE [Cyclobacteriaceae bacterium]|nr:urease accessory protein UreE [Cyclobacteriaceae bacterium]
MIIEQKAGTLQDTSIGSRTIDYLRLEWFETSKRVLRRKTDSGREIAIRFFKEGQRLNQDDIVFMDDQAVVVVDIKPCDAIEVSPKSLLEMGTVCYEIGNKHLPLFIQDDMVLIPFEDPIYKWLDAKGFNPKKVHTRLLNLLNSTVQPHTHPLGIGGSLFSKIMGLNG